MIDMDPNIIEPINVRGPSDITSIHIDLDYFESMTIDSEQNIVIIKINQTGEKQNG